MFLKDTPNKGRGFAPYPAKGAALGTRKPFLKKGLDPKNFECAKLPFGGKRRKKAPAMPNRKALRVLFLFYTPLL